jgi:2-pyrone-4,6-dicarboxylate lactonase
MSIKRGSLASESIIIDGMTNAPHPGLSADELARAPWCAPPDPNPVRPRITLPPNSCDCHAHVFGPMERYPYSADRIYTPPDASLAAYRQMHAALGVTRAVIVQPSVYGSDNRATLDAIQAGGPQLRGVVVVEESVTDAELERMHRIGVRGIRFNIVDVKPGKGELPMTTVHRMAERIKPLGWHVQFLLHVDKFPNIIEMFANFPTEIVIDHFGYMKTSLGIQHPGFQGLLRLVAEGRSWVKFTGPYRISGQAMPFSDVIPYAHALAKANPERIVWGTDWPHPKHEGPMPNDGEMCNRLAEWLPDEALRARALVTNPAKLYGF